MSLKKCRRPRISLAAAAHQLAKKIVWCQKQKKNETQNITTVAPRHFLTRKAYMSLSCASFTGLTYLRGSLKFLCFFFSAQEMALDLETETVQQFWTKDSTALVLFTQPKLGKLRQNIPKKTNCQISTCTHEVRPSRN